MKTKLRISLFPHFLISEESMETVKLLRSTVSLPPAEWSPRSGLPTDTQELLGWQTWECLGPWNSELGGKTQHCHQLVRTLGTRLYFFAPQFLCLWSGVMRVSTSGLWAPHYMSIKQVPQPLARTLWVASFAVITRWGKGGSSFPPASLPHLLPREGPLM